MYHLYQPEAPIRFRTTGRLHYVATHFFEQDGRGMFHSHDFCELFFCIRGSGTFSVQDDVFDVAPMDFVWVEPYVKHAEESSAESPLDYVCLGISGVQLLPDCAREGYCHGSIGQFRDILIPLLSALVKEVSAQEPDCAGLCGSMLEMLMLYLSRAAGLIPQSSPPACDSENHMILWIHQYLTDHFTETIPLDQLAAKAGLNKFSIIRSFQKIYGITPIEYVLRLRAEEAKFLLRTTDNSITQIAAMLRFSSASYFCQFFRAKEGVSPSAYRAQAKQALQPSPSRLPDCPPVISRSDTDR